MNTKTLRLKILIALCALIAVTTASAAMNNVEMSGKMQPEGIISKWMILGPFPNPQLQVSTVADRNGLDTDYLKSIGGEDKARILSDTKIVSTGPDGEMINASAQAVDQSGFILDFCDIYKDADNKLAYAYTEITSTEDQDALFFLGWDDAVKVWINGKQVFEYFSPNGHSCLPREDNFEANLHKGINTVLIKVVNGLGDWQLAVEAYGGDAAKKLKEQIQVEKAQHEFQQQVLTVAKPGPGFVFNPGEKPKIIWGDPERVRELIGDAPLKIRWFDADLNEVTSLDKPGRYAAYIETKMRDGTLVRRIMLFYCKPSELDIIPWPCPELEAPYLGAPIDPDVWKEHSSEINEIAGWIYRTGLTDTETGAWCMAGISEAKPTGTKPTVYELLDTRSMEYLLALKLKVLGLSDKVRPLAAPKRRVVPVPVLHAGAPAEAGVKPDAKEKIDAVCREWAADSGEPFTILVARHGVIITHEAFGKGKDGNPIGLDYRTDVASITKTVTGMLFSRFLDQDYIKLDDPVGKVLEGFPMSGEHMITFRNLTNHTSGLTGHAEYDGLYNAFMDNCVSNGTACLSPGTYIYNGTGFDLTAKAMEIMTGKSLVRMMNENLFNPLGIQNIWVVNCGFGAYLTSYDLAAVAQLLANHGSYGDKQFFSEETFKITEPIARPEYFGQMIYGVGYGICQDRKPSAPADSKDPKDFIFGGHVVGHGSSSACILRVDFDHDLIIVQIRQTAGPKYDDYRPKFFTAIADSLL